MPNFVVGRRAFLMLSASTLAAMRVGPAAAATADEVDPEWPAWAPKRAELYRRLDGEERAAAVDIRSFGALLDGHADDTAAMLRAVESGARVLLVPKTGDGALRLTKEIPIRRPITILGDAAGSVIRWEGKGKIAFSVRPPGDEPTEFVGGIRFDSLVFERPEALPLFAHAVRCANVRNISVTRCRTARMSLLFVNHRRPELKLYKPRKAPPNEDPAVLAGFSATSVDDLNEDIFVYDNDVDAAAYMGDVVRFQFARRIAAVGNKGNYARVSWWGGGAKHDQGGNAEFLRRAQDAYISGNEFFGANGGVYGNNGRNILVSHNKISYMTDVGVDFEGCTDCVAHHNLVTNVGNFCYVTFYVAKNILFHDNIGIQDGGGKDLHLRFGEGSRYGAMNGNTFFALRSAGFGGVPDVIDVRVVDNTFQWKGDQGLGRCQGSFFNSVELTGNIFDNVTCNLSYGKTDRLIIRDNRITARQAADKPTALVTGSAKETRIVDNTITSEVVQPEGSTAALVRSAGRGREVEVSGNKVACAPGDPLPFVVLMEEGRLGGTWDFHDNRVPAIMATKPELIDSRDNLDAEGRPVAPALVPEGFPPK